MKLPLTLSFYIARHFLFGIMLALFGLIAITMLIDVVELIRRASGKDLVTFGVIIQMSALKVPYLMEKMVPYAVLIGSMLALTKLTRTHELIVARSAGVSVWQFLAPAVSVALLLGVFFITVFNPFASVLLMHFEQMEGKYFSGRPSLLSISSSGLWLRQIESKDKEYIIYSMRVSQNDMSFANVIVFGFKNNKFSERLDAQRAVLEQGNLHLQDVMFSVPGKPPQRMADYSLPTTLTLSHIQDSFASPETMSFWHLPTFIGMLEKAGFSALRHRVHWYALLVSPFLLAGAVLVAAVFSLRLPRRGKVGLLAVAGVMTGFLLYFFTDIVFALGEGGTLPPLFSALTPACVMIMLGAALLLHLEDG